MDSAPVTTALPLGVASWWLCLAGAAATFLAARAFPRMERGAVKLLAVGAAIAVVVAAVVTVGALRAGDDGRFVDSSTAAATDVPAIPTALGKRTFTVSVPDAFADKDVSVYDIDSAGAGFAVYQHGRITGYGSDGKERWHYARTGPAEIGVNGMRVVDNGATVVAFIDGGLVGLDAVTGAQLWASGDEALGAAVRGRYRAATGPLIVGWNDERIWTRYDSRTGRVLWSVPAPHLGCGITEPIVTASGVVSTVQCEDGKVWLSVLDPETGQIGWDTVLAEQRSTRRHRSMSATSRSWPGRPTASVSSYPCWDPERPRRSGTPISFTAPSARCRRMGVWPNPMVPVMISWCGISMIGLPG